MDSPLTANGEALRLFFTDDIYLIHGEASAADMEEVNVTEPTAVALHAEVPAQAPVLPVKVPAQQLSFEYMGKNSRNILLLVNDPEHAVSDENGRELLRKIVKSVNLTANDFALVNYAKCGSATFSQFQEFFSSVLIFAFGVSPSQLGLGGHPPHTIVKEGAVSIIFSSELKALDADPAGKKQLWGSLKQLELS